MLQSLNEYWEQSPPTHLLVAAFVGYKSQRHSAADVVAAILQMGGSVTVGGQVLGSGQR